MERGICAISLDPYNSHQYLYVCYGIGPDELIEKFRLDSDFYSKKAENLKILKQRSNDLEAVKAFVESERDWIKRYAEEAYSGGTCYFEKGDYEKGRPGVFMFIPLLSSTSYTDWMITLAHECLHACQFILPLYLNRDEEMEGEAYFHSYLMRETINRINNKEMY